MRPWRPWRPCLPAGPAVISPRGQVMRPDLHLAGALLQRFAAQPSQHGVGLLTGRPWRGRPVRAPVRRAELAQRQPPRAPSGCRWANPPAPGRLGPWGSSVPRGTPTAFPSLARESLVLRPEGRFDLTTATGAAQTHRPAVRRPGPSARLAGAPTRISRSSRVGPSGQLLTVGAHQMAVKAAFPLASRVCPASGGSNYVAGIWGEEPSPWAKHAQVPTGSALPWRSSPSSCW